MKNSMARITQNRWIALFSLWYSNQSEAGKKRMENYLFNEKKNILYDSQSTIWIFKFHQDVFGLKIKLRILSAFRVVDHP